MKRVGIYSRSNNVPATWNEINPHILNGLKWMYLNDYDSFTLYSEEVNDEFNDLSDRTELNRLIYDVENGNIDAVFVNDITILSPISIKALQAIISLQEAGINLYHTNGLIEANDENFKILKKQLEEDWKRIQESTKNTNLGG